MPPLQFNSIWFYSIRIEQHGQAHLLLLAHLGGTASLLSPPPQRCTFPTLAWCAWRSPGRCVPRIPVGTVPGWTARTARGPCRHPSVRWSGGSVVVTWYSRGTVNNKKNKDDYLPHTLSTGSVISLTPHAPLYPCLLHPSSCTHQLYAIQGRACGSVLPKQLFTTRSCHNWRVFM